MRSKQSLQGGYYNDSRVTIANSSGLLPFVNPRGLLIPLSRAFPPNSSFPSNRRSHIVTAWGKRALNIDLIKKSRETNIKP
jgi:hypothetical protein